MRLERTISWSQTRRDTNFAIPGYLLFSMIPRRTVKIKIFLSVVIYVVKAAFMPFSTTGGNSANAGVARLCGVSPHTIPDTATALPKQAHCKHKAKAAALLCGIAIKIPREIQRGICCFIGRQTAETLPDRLPLRRHRRGGPRRCGRVHRANRPSASCPDCGWSAWC